MIFKKFLNNLKMKHALYAILFGFILSISGLVINSFNNTVIYFVFSLLCVGTVIIYIGILIMAFDSRKIMDLFFEKNNVAENTELSNYFSSNVVVEQTFEKIPHIQSYEEKKRVKEYVKMSKYLAKQDMEDLKQSFLYLDFSVNSAERQKRITILKSFIFPLVIGLSQDYLIDRTNLRETICLLGTLDIFSFIVAAAIIIFVLFMILIYKNVVKRWINGDYDLSRLKLRIIKDAIEYKNR